MNQFSLNVLSDRQEVALVGGSGLVLVDSNFREGVRRARMGCSVWVTTKSGAPGKGLGLLVCPIAWKL